MKLFIYSQQLSKAAYDLSTKHFNKLEFDVMKNDLMHINSVYDQEASLFDKVAKNPNYRRKMKYETGLLSDVILGMKKVSVFNPVDNKASIIANVKERNRVKKRKQNIDSLTEELKKKYMEKISQKADKIANIPSITNFQTLENTEEKIIQKKLHLNSKKAQNLITVYSNTTASEQKNINTERLSRNKCAFSNNQSSAISSNRSYCNKTTTRDTPAIKSMNGDHEGLQSTKANLQNIGSLVHSNRKKNKQKIQNTNRTSPTRLISIKKRLRNLVPAKGHFPFKEVIPSKDEPAQVFTTNFSLNHFLIRDFLIGKNADPVENAEKKKQVATQSYTAIVNHKRKLITKGQEIREETKNRDKLADIEMKTQGDDELIKIKEEQKRHFAWKAQENARKTVEMFENLSEEEYEPIESLSAQLISEKNLRRVRKVRELMRGRVKSDEDDLGLNIGEKQKEEMRMNNNELMMMLNKLGPQKFVKKKFKKNTVERFNIVNGKYFGIGVA